MSDIVIRADNLGKRYRIGERERYLALREVLARAASAPARMFTPRAPSFSHGDRLNGDHSHIWALRDVSFDIHQGEVVGFVGRNGAGKTTLLKILARVTKPTQGFAEVRGRMGSLLEVGTGFHPELTGRENVFLSGAILGMSKTEIQRKFDEIVDFAEVEKFIDTPLKHYSTGMQMRLAFAVAAHLEPEILLVDEVLAVGDISFQKKCLGKMREVSRTGRTIVFVSHQLNQIRRLCTRVIWLDGGQIRESGATPQVLASYESVAMSRTNGNGHRGGALDSRDRARFLSWEVVEPRGYDANVVDGLGPVTIKMTLHVKEPIRRATHGISLYNQDRQLMWGWAAFDFDIPAGDREFVFRLPSLPLRPGCYQWKVSLADCRGQVDVWECVPGLVVATDPVSHPRDEWSGVLNVPARFSVL